MQAVRCLSTIFVCLFFLSCGPVHKIARPENEVASEQTSPGTDGEGVDVAPKLEPTYASIAKNILLPKCVHCHGPRVARLGARFDSYIETLFYVVPNSPEFSELYTQIRRGLMPPPPDDLLTEEEVSTIFEWINNGALEN